MTGRKISVNWKIKSNRFIQGRKIDLWAVRPIRKSVTLEELIAEQNYQPIKKEEFFRKTSELEIEESLEELLAMLD